MERAEDDWGAWGALYRDDDGRLLGSIQYGPAELFPRAAELPAGPPSDDAVLVTCVYVVSAAMPWVEQSLFLAAIGEARDKGAKALEAFAYRYPEGESTYERFLVHRTVFPRDFLADFGFRFVRAQGRVELATSGARRPRAGGGGQAGRGSARGQGGVRAGTGAAAALSLAANCRPDPRRIPSRLGSGAARRARAQRQSPEPPSRKLEPADGQEAPVVAAVTEGEAQDAEAARVHGGAARQPAQHGVDAAPARPDDEGADPVDRREALVVVVVTREHDVGACARERVPESGHRHVRPVQPGAEARVVPVGQRARCGARREVGGEPALLRRACFAPSGRPAVRVQDDDVPGAELVRVVAAIGQPEVRLRGAGSRRAVLVVPERRSRPRPEPPPRVAVPELRRGAALVDGVAEDRDRARDTRATSAAVCSSPVDRHEAMSPAATTVGVGASSASAVASAAITRRRGAAPGRARRSGSHSAPRPCAGCRPR